MFQGPNFGASASTPFGQSTFGKPATTGFSTPVFGTTGGTSLFGGPTTQPSGNLFGSSTSTPAFGQPQTTQPTFGGGFSSGTGTTGLFGSQQNANTGTGLFGSGTTSTFGQTKPTFGGFGTNQQSTGLFGQQAQQPQQQSSLFGQPAGQSATGLFGSTFGNTAQGGTTIKFTPVTGSDTMVKNGASTTISTRHQCITCMKEYESKSLEELRLEDYTANRKGPQQGTQTGTGLFGSGGQTSLFGTTTNTANASGFGTAGSSVFGTGTSTANPLFGKTTGTGAPTFGTPATTAATGFGFNTNTNLFGTNTTQVKPFGAPTQGTGLFGATSQPSTGFGTQSPGFGGFGAPQPGGLFTQNKSAFTLGTTPNPGFGFGQTSTPSTTGASLFGSKPATTGFGTTFGTPATTNTGFGATSFGTTNQNTSLFGSNFKGPTNFSFGQTPTSNTLGAGLSLSSGTTSFFGSTANKPGGFFGQNTGANTGFFGTGTFGNTASPFNTTSNTGLGQTSFPMVNTGTNLMQGGGIGANQAASANNTINQHMLALASMPFGDSPLFKNLLTVSGKADELIKPTSPAAQKALISGQNFKISPKSGSKIKVKPIGTNNMTKKSLFDGLESEEENANDSLVNTIRPCPKRLVLKPRIFSESNNRSYLFSDTTSNENGADVSPVAGNLPVASTTPTTTVTTPVGSPNTPTASRFITPSLSSRTRTPDTLPKEVAANNISHGKTTPLKQPLENLVPNDTILELRPQSKSTPSNSPRSPTESNKDVAEQSTSSSSGDSELEDTVAAEIDGDCEDHPTGIILRRIGYYTIPPLDKLTALMDNEGRCIVDNFTIGRLNYGNIFYPDSFDVAGLNIDEIVHFRHKEVVVYPADDNKPPVGSGLNRKAQVTLDRVWPIDKTTRLPISDPIRIAALDYENKLRQASAKHGTRFVEYRPHTGSWVFKVDHFSKYGLSDSDEEENAVSDEKKLKLINMQGAALLMKTPAVPPVALPHKISTGLSGVDSSSNLLLGEEDEDMEDGINTPFDLDDELERGTALSPTSKLARHLGTSSHKVQLMKASFFEADDFHIDGDSLDYEQVPDMNNYVNEYSSQPDYEQSKMAALPFYRGSSFVPVEADVSEADELDIAESINMKARDDSVVPEGATPNINEVRPVIYSLKYTGEMVRWADSTAGKLESKCLLELSIMMGRRFTVGWGPRNQMTALLTSAASTNIAPSMSLSDLVSILGGRSSQDMSKTLVHRLQICGGVLEDPEVTFQETIEPHLKIALDESIVSVDEEGIPSVVPKSGVAGLHKHCYTAQELGKGSKDTLVSLSDKVWGLCFALWGDLPDCEVPESHNCVMQRREAVSEWLQSVVKDVVKAEVSAYSHTDTAAVFTLLTGANIAEACARAQQLGDHRLSLLLSQASCGAGVRVLLEKQLNEWRETEGDHFISTDRIKSMMLVAGLPVHIASYGTVNTCSDLDWLRAFAIHLWYICPLSASVTDALILYEKAFQGDENEDDNYAVAPLPSYCADYIVENSSGLPVYDIMYHLLKLFSTKSHPLEQLLNPATHSPDPLDYRLSWLLMRVLSSVGYSHMSDHCISLIHSSFADQLESHGLWQWAVFVLLHISDPSRRANAVQDMISRHITVDDENENETFLKESLHVPLTWIYESKATRAISENRYEQAAKYLIQAENWNLGHTVIMENIASKAIINEKYSYLLEMLEELKKEDRWKQVWGWQNGGCVIYEYLIIVKEVEDIVHRQDPNVGYHLERLKPLLTDLCTRIKLLPVHTPVDRLSQAEMAKRCSSLVRSLLLVAGHSTDDMSENGDGVNTLSQLIGELPLPNDYTLQEWQAIAPHLINDVADSR